MASTKCVLLKHKTLVCQFGNQEKCVESDTVFNPDFKVIIKDIAKTDREGEESGVSSGYESEHANQNHHSTVSRRKRKLSKRKELLGSAFVESHTDVKVHRTSTKRALLNENIQQIESSDLDSAEANNTSSDEESVFSEDSSTDSEKRNSESEHQPSENNLQQNKGIDDSLPQNIISNFSDVPVAEWRDQQVSFSGNYRFYYQK